VTAHRRLTLASSAAGAALVALDGTVLASRRVGARRTAGAAMVVLALGVLVLGRASGTVAVCGGFALLGAGYGTVMVAATHVVVRQAAVESAGVAGGLNQTAVNVGPALGLAAASALMGAGHGTRSPLLVLAAVAAAGAVAARALPGRDVASITQHVGTADRSRIPARP